MLIDRFKLPVIYTEIPWPLQVSCRVGFGFSVPFFVLILIVFFVTVLGFWLKCFEFPVGCVFVCLSDSTTHKDTGNNTHRAGPRTPGVSILTHFILRAAVAWITDTLSLTVRTRYKWAPCLASREKSFHLIYKLIYRILVQHIGIDCLSTERFF